MIPLQYQTPQPLPPTFAAPAVMRFGLGIVFSVVGVEIAAAVHDGLPNIDAFCCPLIGNLIFSMLCCFILRVSVFVRERLGRWPLRERNRYASFAVGVGLIGALIVLVFLVKSHVPRRFERSVLLTTILSYPVAGAWLIFRRADA